MATPDFNTTQHPHGSAHGRMAGAVSLFLISVLFVACSTTDRNARAVANIAPLQWDGRLVTAAGAYERVPAAQLLAVDDDMRDFVQRYTGNIHQDRQRLMMLHRAVRGAATLGMEYDPLAEGAAQEVFRRGAANCLAYATLFVALAREAGLSAGYQQLHVRPQWTRQGERVAVRLHVNAVVTIGAQERYMVDIDPLPSRDIAGSRTISDTDALALHHSNIAMNAFAENDIEEAWLQAVRALQLSPAIPHLWVNLGVIYRANGQQLDAEQSYLYALQLDPKEHSAMNNLVVLYALQGRQVEREVWAQRVTQWREANPYYHAWLGEKAAEGGDWRLAVRHYERALKLSPDDSRLLFVLGQSHEHLGESAIALAYLQRAINSAAAPTELVFYQEQLDTLQEKQRAGS